MRIKVVNGICECMSLESTTRLCLQNQQHQRNRQKRYTLSLSEGTVRPPLLRPSWASHHASSCRSCETYTVHETVVPIPNQLELNEPSNLTCKCYHTNEVKLMPLVGLWQQLLSTGATACVLGDVLRQ